MRIIIAEDDPSIRESLQWILNREGYDVSTASNGTEALRIWHQQGADLLCLDVMMPEMDGFELCRAIRDQDPLVTILFLSAKTEVSDVVAGLEWGADDYIRKPFIKHELLARVRSAIRKSRSRGASDSATCFTFGGWQVSLPEMRIKSGKQQVDLSAKEAAILQYFHEHEGEAVTRDQLLDACWGMDFYPESRMLDQQMSRLRKKLGDSRASLIQTVRGVGYRYVPTEA